MKQKDRSMNWKAGSGTNPNRTAKKKKKGILKSKDSLKDLQDNIEWNNIVFYWSQKEKREKEAEKLFEEILAENFSNLGKKQTSTSRKPRNFQKKR